MDGIKFFWNQFRIIQTLLLYWPVRVTAQGMMTLRIVKNKEPAGNGHFIFHGRADVVKKPPNTKLLKALFIYITNPDVIPTCAFLRGTLIYFFFLC